MSTTKKVKHCNECGIKTTHYHIGFLDGAKHYSCPKHCAYANKECKGKPIIEVEE